MSALSNIALSRYAVFGIPLGFIGLPLYVLLPKYYADSMPLSLASIGAVMLFARLFDCFADPWIGYGFDHFPALRQKLVATARITIALGVFGLFYLPQIPGNHIVMMMSGLLSLTYISYSILNVDYYMRGLDVSHHYDQNTRISAWRESAIIIGVLVASSLPQILLSIDKGWDVYHLFSFIFIAILIAAATLSPSRRQQGKSPAMIVFSLRGLLRNKPLLWVFALFFINAIPPSITATLFEFFASDVLRLPQWSGAFLGIYFLSAVMAMPLWAGLSRHVPKRNCLIFSMSLAIASFMWTYGLSEGSALQFSIICLLSGAALGGDLTLLPSLLADVIAQDGSQGGIEFGIWNFISKFTLALAAGIALPMLGWLGYVPNEPSHNTQSLLFCYSILPIFFKLLALSVLLVSNIDKQRK